jgi:hypothetical protein
MAPPDCEPGACFRYSDLNYVVAGAVIEAATGSGVPELVRRRFLRPLGMTHTWFQGEERAQGRVATAYRDGAPDSDGSAFVPTIDFVTRTGVSGAVATTAADLTTWGAALFGGKVLDKESLHTMLDFEASADLACPVAEQCTGGYGLGMEQDHMNAFVTWQHTGSTGAVLAHFPKSKVTMAVLTNGSPGAANPVGAARALGAAIPATRSRTRVYAMAADGSGVHPVTATRLGASEPAVSPDGAELAFTAERARTSTGAATNSSVAVSDIDGRHVRFVTDPIDPAAGPDWSPDGRSLVFTSARDGTLDVYQVDADGTDEVRLTDDPGDDGHPSWSPDGSLVAYDHRDGDSIEIRVVSPDGGAPRTVVRTMARVPFPGEPAWHPDSRTITFTGEANGSMQLFDVALDGSGLTPITAGHAPSAEAAWAPGGTLLFARMGALRTRAPSAGDLSPPLGLPFRENYYPEWAPDSRMIYFTANS